MKNKIFKFNSLEDYRTQLINELQEVNTQCNQEPTAVNNIQEEDMCSESSGFASHEEFLSYLPKIEDSEFLINVKELKTDEDKDKVHYYSKLLGASIISTENGDLFLANSNKTLKGMENYSLEELKNAWNDRLRVKKKC